MIKDECQRTGPPRENPSRIALHPEFPKSPYAPLLPEHRWFPAAEELRATAIDRLLPPLVARIRENVQQWRDSGYAGASATTRTLLRWWFDTEHLSDPADGMRTPFRYYFAQREAVETVTVEQDRVTALDREDRELRIVNEILKVASAFFSRAEIYRHLKRRWPLSRPTETLSGRADL